MKYKVIVIEFANIWRYNIESWLNANAKNEWYFQSTFSDKYCVTFIFETNFNPISQTLNDFDDIEKHPRF